MTNRLRERKQVGNPAKGLQDWKTTHTAGQMHVRCNRVACIHAHAHAHICVHGGWEGCETNVTNIENAADVHRNAKLAMHFRGAHEAERRFYKKKKKCICESASNERASFINNKWIYAMPARWMNALLRCVMCFPVKKSLRSLLLYAAFSHRGLSVVEDKLHFATQRVTDFQDRTVEMGDERGNINLEYFCDMFVWKI